MDEDEKNRRRRLAEAEEGVELDESQQGRSSRWPSTEELRSNLTRAIHKAMDRKQFVVIQAPTSSGKSYNGAATRWRELDVTGGRPVVHFHFRTESRREAAEQSVAAGVEHRELLGRDEACPVAAGEYDTEVAAPDDKDPSEWIRIQCDIKGNELSDVHSYLERENGGELPCTPCPSSNQWEGIPYDSDNNVSADVIHATHQFSYISQLTQGANLIFDEQPDFKTSVGGNESDDFSFTRLQKIVTAWLKETGAPAHDWEEFVTMSKRSTNNELVTYFDRSPSVDDDWFITNRQAHQLAPALTRAIYRALSGEIDDNGRRVGRATNPSRTHTPESPEDERPPEERQNGKDPRFGRTRITVVYNEPDRKLVFWNVPELGIARSIVGLDAWPSMHEWRQNIGSHVDEVQAISTAAFEQWRRFDRGLEVVQIGDRPQQATTLASVNKYTDPATQRAVIESLRERYGDDFDSIIYPDALSGQILPFLPDGFEVLTLGGVRSNNSFASKRIGLVMNSIDPGDDYVLDLLAARGLDAVPEPSVCPNCSGDGCEHCDGGVARAEGRGFVGPDATEADKMLDGMRNHETAQAVGRWARETDGPRALVFVRTSTVPDEMVDTRIPDAWKFTDKQRTIIAQLTQTEGLSAKQAAAGHDLGKAHARDTMQQLVEEYGVATRIRGAGDNGADLYMLDCAIPEDGLLDVFRDGRL